MSIATGQTRGDPAATAAAATVPAVATHDPVCGMRADPATARAACVHEGIAVGFCCQGCRDRFLAAPGRYAHAHDPVCGALVERIRPGATARHEGRRYWFCGERCREQFDARPARFADASQTATVSARDRPSGRSRGPDLSPPAA